MSDATSIAAIFTSIKTATELAKIIKDSHSSLDEAESKYKLAELIESLANAKIEIADIQKTILKKDKEINQLQKKLELQNKITWDDPYYWLGDKKDGDGPYCQNCFDDREKLIHLQGSGNGHWYCNACSNGFYDDSYEANKNIKMGPEANDWESFI